MVTATITTFDNGDGDDNNNPNDNINDADDHYHHCRHHRQAKHKRKTKNKKQKQQQTLKFTGQYDPKMFQFGFRFIDNCSDDELRSFSFLLTLLI